MKFRGGEKRKKKDKGGREGRVRGREGGREDEDSCLSCQKVDLFYLSEGEEASYLPLMMFWCCSELWSPQRNSSTGKFPCRSVTSESPDFGEEKLNLLL